MGRAFPENVGRRESGSQEVSALGSLKRGAHCAGPRQGSARPPARPQRPPAGRPTGLISINPALNEVTTRRNVLKSTQALALALAPALTSCQSNEASNGINLKHIVGGHVVPHWISAHTRLSAGHNGI